jgi:S1-C subfamily serine protease
MDNHEHETQNSPAVGPRDASASLPWGTSPSSPPSSPRPAGPWLNLPRQVLGVGRPASAAGRRRSPWLSAGAAALVLTGAALGIHAVTSPSASSAPVLARPEWSGGASAGAGWSAGGGFSRGGLPGGGFSGGGSGQTTTTASDAQQAGVVDIDVTLGSRGEQAAGTGMILTSNGEVLTNRHVVEGETSISVRVAATGRAYAAHVVGVAADTDVAVVQMEGASGLATVAPASQAVSVGDTVVGVGNAGGQGGTPSAAPGQVTGVGQSITATDQGGSDPEDLTGLIETDAAIQPGDSGGPLVNTSNQVVGMDTAGSERGAPDAYAIPIGTALAAARQIESGGGVSASQGSTGQGNTGQGNTGQGGTGQSSTQQAGSAYLGVELQDGLGGVQVVSVVPGSPASATGLSAGDTITSIGRQPVQRVSDVGSVLGSLSAGQHVSLTWTDQDGQAQTSTATLGSRPTT